MPSKRRFVFPWVAASLTLVAILLRALPLVGARLELDLERIIEGEVWRLVTGHFVHYGRAHFVGDVAGFALWTVLLEFHLRRLLVLTLLVSIPVVTTIILLSLPPGGHCRGLSGIATALAVVLLLEAFIVALAQKRSFVSVLAGAALAAFVAKTLYELSLGRALLAPELGAGVTLLPEAHLAGIAAGLLAWHYHRAAQHCLAASRNVPRPGARAYVPPEPFSGERAQHLGQPGR